MIEQKTLNMTPKRREKLREVAEWNSRQHGFYWYQETMSLLAKYGLVEHRGTEPRKGGWWITGNGKKLLADLDART